MNRWSGWDVSMNQLEHTPKGPRKDSLSRPKNLSLRRTIPHHRTFQLSFSQNLSLPLSSTTSTTPTSPPVPSPASIANTVTATERSMCFLEKNIERQFFLNLVKSNTPAPKVRLSGRHATIDRQEEQSTHDKQPSTDAGGNHRSHRGGWIRGPVRLGFVTLARIDEAILRLADRELLEIMLAPGASARPASHDLGEPTGLVCDMPIGSPRVYLFFCGFYFYSNFPPNIVSIKIVFAKVGEKTLHHNLHSKKTHYIPDATDFLNTCPSKGQVRENVSWVFDGFGRIIWSAKKKNQCWRLFKEFVSYITCGNIRLRGWNKLATGFRGSISTRSWNFAPPAVECADQPQKKSQTFK